MRSEGFAMFSILVGPDGKAEIVKLIVSSGSEPLDESAEDAARQTVFSPATKNGVKVRMWKTLRFEFKKTKGF
jgi:TonB family protein